MKKGGLHMAEVKKVVLAYSGGLDTSCIIPWLKENYDCEVIACTVNLGQPEDFDAIHQKALDSGADVAVTIDARKEFIENYAYQVLRADGRYEGKYLLGTSIARPLIGKILVDVAKEYGADAVSHGATGKGNDQVRFELAVKALNPHLTIIAPWRLWTIKSREDAMAYAAAHHVPIQMYDEKQTDEEKEAQKYPYSMDWNIWHLSHEGDDLENPANAPHKDMFLVTCDPEDAKDEPELITLSFEKGVPVALDGKKLSGLEMIEALNAIGARNGIGIDDIVENRLVGMKSRGVYENPGAAILFYAHRELEYLCLDRATLHFKESAAIRYSELVYDGMWFAPLREALQAFADETSKTVTGEVTLRLYKGNIMSHGAKSPYSLYNEEFVTFGEDDVYNQADAGGFINLFGLPLTIRALMKEKNEK